MQKAPDDCLHGSGGAWASKRREEGIRGNEYCYLYTVIYVSAYCYMYAMYVSAYCYLAAEEGIRGNEYCYVHVSAY